MTLRIGDHSKIRSGTVLYAGSKIGSRLETGHNVIIREQNDIGNDVKIWSNSVIDYGCKIRNNVKIHCGCYVAQQTIIEDNVFMAPGVTIANEKYPTGYYRSARIQAPVIKRGAKLGINATILPGVVIGRDAIVGAGSVVTRDVPAQATVYGNPARPCKTKDANVNW
jgi:acetyltransferase-like isoleucine patch superfamily enzyme